MAPLLPYIAAAASVGSAIGQGNAQNEIGKIQADQLNKQAIAAEADAVQAAKYERAKAKLVASRATSVAAASGSAIASQDIQNLLSDIDQQGEYNALAALHSGYSSSDSRKYAASVAKYEGASAQSQSMYSAGSTILGTMDKVGAFNKSAGKK